jgi:hypothetical protein
MQTVVVCMTADHDDDDDDDDLQADHHSHVIPYLLKLAVYRIFSMDVVNRTRSSPAFEMHAIIHRRLKSARTPLDGGIELRVQTGNIRTATRWYKA